MLSIAVPRVKFLTSENDQNTNDPSTDFVYDIFYAARQGDFEAVQRFVKLTPKSVNYVDRYGNRALYYACLCGHEKIVRFLLQAGDPYDFKSVEGHRYYLASLTHHVKCLLEYSQTSGFSKRNFTDAVENGNIAKFQDILQEFKKFHKINENEKFDLSDIDDAGFIQIAQQMGHNDMIEFLLELGAHNNVAMDMARNFSNRNSCDIVISVNGSKFPCHLAIFECRAPVLYSFLQDRIANNDIELNFDFPYAIFGFEALLRFLYTGKINYKGEEHAGLQELGNHLPIPEMRKTDSVSHSLSQLRTFSKHYDFKLVSVDGIEIPVHKFILTSRCEYFSRMLNGSFVESASDRFTIGESTDTLNALLDYLYSDQVKLTDVQVAVDLIGIANEYLLKPLKIACEEYIIRNGIDIFSVPDVLMYARTISAKALLEYCTERVVTHFEELRDTPQFESLPSKVKTRSRDVWQKKMNKKLRAEEMKREQERQQELRRKQAEEIRLAELKREEAIKAIQSEQQAALQKFLQRQENIPQSVEKETVEEKVHKEEGVKFVPKPVKVNSEMKDLKSKYANVKKR